MSGIQSDYQAYKEIGKHDIDQMNNRSKETKPELTQMLELAQKDIKTVITVLCMFKKLSEDMEDTED